MKMTTFDLVQGTLFLISIAAFWRASASTLKLVEYFPIAVTLALSEETCTRVQLFWGGAVFQFSVTMAFVFPWYDTGSSGAGTD